MKKRWIGFPLESCIYEFTASDEGRGRPALLLHGFPGEKNKQDEDLAEYLAGHFEAPSYILHYRGLGDAKDGKFSFSGAVLESERVLRALYEQKGTLLNVLGHGFGGLIGLNLLKRNPKMIDRLILLSPVTQLPGRETCERMIQHAVKVEGVRFKQESLSEVLRDLESVRNQYEPVRFTEALKDKVSRIHVIQAANDEEVPTESTRNFVKATGISNYTELDDLHAQIRKCLTERIQVAGVL